MSVVVIKGWWDQDKSAQLLNDVGIPARAVLLRDFEQRVRQDAQNIAARAFYNPLSELRMVIVPDLARSIAPDDPYAWRLLSFGADETKGYYGRLRALMAQAGVRDSVRFVLASLSGEARDELPNARVHGYVEAPVRADKESEARFFQEISKHFPERSLSSVEQRNSWRTRVQGKQARKHLQP